MVSKGNTSRIACPTGIPLLYFHDLISPEEVNNTSAARKSDGNAEFSSRLMHLPSHQVQSGSSNGQSKEGSRRGFKPDSEWSDGHWTSKRISFWIKAIGTLPNLTQRTDASSWRLRAISTVPSGRAGCGQKGQTLFVNDKCLIAREGEQKGLNQDIGKLVSGTHSRSRNSGIDQGPVSTDEKPCRV